MKKILFKSGFTLVELLVVIAIIGILTAIVASNFTSARARARDAKRISDINQIQLALEQAFDKCSVFPTDIVNINDNISGCIVPGTPFSTFISVVPKDPITLASYDYVLSGTDYVLRAKLEINSTALVDDIDGAPLGQASGYCDDSPNYYYCIQPK